ncbi:hypothetical protein [Pedobacter deserti]|uniref:hypothetical protein n=1 Tax=Pedobacter deserti TaxID=2817382 RepID=UPI00210DD5D4|nr:hypothetical protein [Pedobacter sp. SYSU D00382]
MNKSLILPASVSLLFFSCTSDKSSQHTDDTITNNTDTACYMWVSDRDTVEMKLNMSDDDVNGELNYKWYEKDKNLGSFTGKMNGDTLVGDYTFQSEGMQSVREIVFLRKAEQLLQGTGEMTEQGGKVIFKDKSKLSFSKDIVLDKTDCH